MERESQTGSPFRVRLRSQYPNEMLRKKLVVAGIPASEHSLKALTAKIPGDFNAPTFQDMSPDMMAELVIYFIAKGVIALPVACDKALLDMPWGSHVCQFFNGKEDLVKMLVPYFKQGLEKNDACVWLVGEHGRRSPHGAGSGCAQP